MIVNILPVGPYEANCYLVGAEKGAAGIVIDPGDESDIILAKIVEEEFKIGLIVLTHGHLDHYGALKEIRDATGAPIAINAEDAGSLAKNELSARFNPSGLPAPAPERFLKNGDVITSGSLIFTVLHTPGHSPGSICLYGEKALFSGDTLFREGIGRSDLPGGNYRVLMNSLQRLMALPEDTIVYPGHGPRTTIGLEKRQNPFLSG